MDNCSGKMKALPPTASGSCRRKSRALALGHDGALQRRHLGRPIHLIDLEFSQKDRNIAACKVEQAA